MNKKLEPFQAIILEIQTLSQQITLIEKHQVALYSLAIQLTALIETLDLILDGHLNRPYDYPIDQVKEIIIIIKNSIADTETKIEIGTDPSLWHQYIKSVLNGLIDALNLVFVQLNLTPISRYETKNHALHQWTLKRTPEEKSIKARLEDNIDELDRIYPKIKNGY